MKNNILHVIYSFYTGGAEEIIINYAKSYDKNNFELSVCVLTDGDHMLDNLQSTGVNVFVLHKNPGIDLSIMRQIRNIIIENNIKILHLHNPAAQNYALISSFFSTVEIRIRTEHNVYYKNRVMPFYGIINYILTLFQNKVIACSKSVEQSQLNNYHLPKAKVTTINNGINGNKFQINVDDNYLESTANIIKKKYVITTIGNLIVQKGHEYFIETARLILIINPDVTFLIVGEGKQRTAIESLINKYGLSDNIYLLGKRSDIPELLSLSDIFLLTSLWEGLPIVLLEAMAAKKAIITTDVGGNSEVIIDNYTGILVPPRDPAAAASEVLKLIDSESDRVRLGFAAYELFNNKYSAEIMSRTTESLYLTCLNSH